MLEWDARGRVGIDGELDARLSIPELRGDLGDDGLDGAVLGPRKAIEADARVLPGVCSIQECATFRNPP